MLQSLNANKKGVQNFGYFFANLFILLKSITFFRRKCLKFYFFKIRKIVLHEICLKILQLSRFSLIFVFYEVIAIFEALKKIGVLIECFYENG